MLQVEAIVVSDIARREAAFQAQTGLNPLFADEEACLAQLALRARLLNDSFQVETNLRNPARL